MADSNHLTAGPAELHGVPLRDSPPALRPIGSWLRDAAASGKGKLTCCSTRGTSQLSYDDLWVQARRLADTLAREVPDAAEVVVCLARADEFLAAVWGGILWGRPVLPIRLVSSQAAIAAQRERLARWCSLLSRPVIVGNDATRPVVTDTKSGYPRHVAFDELSASGNPTGSHLEPGDDRDRPVLLMPTSGSTGRSKLVALNERNIAAHCQATVEHCRVDADCRTLNWLALDHVGGLVMWHLRDSFVGCHQIHIDSDVILEAPRRWLELLSQHRVTHTWAPHFALALIRDELLRGVPPALDLSCLRQLLTAGETVMSDTLLRLEEELSSHGLSPGTLRAGWGMTETSSLATLSGEADQRAWERHSLATVGTPLPGLSVRILRDDGTPARYGESGELQVRGKQVAAGYYEHGTIHNALSADGWLSTGDLAVVDEGLLRITGRQKEVLVVRGLKYSAAEIESAVESLAEIATGCVAAVSITGQDGFSDDLILFYSLRSEVDSWSEEEAAHRIREVLVQRLGISPRRVVRIAAAELPRTSIGKIQRARLASAWIAGELQTASPARPTADADASRRGNPVQTDDAPFAHPSIPLRPLRNSPDEIRLLISQIFQDAWGLEPIDPDVGFVDQGGDSLRAMRVVSRVREHFGTHCEVADLLMNPTIAEWSDRIAAQIVEFGPTAQNQTVPNRKLRPASSGEHRLWSISQAVRGQLAKQSVPDVNHAAPDQYAVVVSLGMTGAIDAAELQRCLNILAGRHDVLRSKYVEIDGKTMVRIGDEYEWPLDVVTVDSLEDDEVAAHAEDLERLPFDLVKGPLVRAKFLQTPRDEQALIIGLHHLVCDRWSLQILLQELADLLGAAAVGQELQAQPTQANYADFVAAERAMLEGEAGEHQLAWWCERLRGISQPTRKQPIIWSGEGPPFATRTTCVSRSVFEQMEFVRRHEGATLFMSLFAAYAAVMARYAGTGDVAVATPVSCRHKSEWEEIVGFFANTIILRTSVSGTNTFAELLAAVRRDVIDSCARGWVPLDRIVDRLRPLGDASHAPFTPLAFAVHDPWPARLDCKAVTIHSPRVRITTSRFPLEVHVWPTPDGLEVIAHFDQSRWDEVQVEQFLDDYRSLLNEVARDPHRPLAECPLESVSRAAAALRPLGEPAQSPDRVEVVHSAFEAIARAYPATIAVQDGNETWTYGQLEQLATGFAGYLQGLGVTPGSAVAIGVVELPTFVIAALAVMKAGGCYVPVEPDWPAERLRVILESAQCELLLCNSASLIKRDSLAARQVPVTIASIEASATTFVRPLVPVAGDSIACIFTTSGSTGSPKGVLVRHGSIMNLVHAGDYLATNPGDVIGQAASFAFDASSFELWGALLRGATVVGLQREEILSSDRLRAALERHRITTLFLTTALLHELVRQDPGCFSRLTTLLFGGELVDARRIQQLLAQAPPRRLVHVYGPTEATTFSTWQEVTRVESGDWTVPIGVPTRGTRAYVLDANLERVPPGVPGELYLAGSGIAAGYSGAPAATAERFLPDPFGNQPGERMYRTGDLVRQRREGSLEFLGRTDEQIKLRGYRIEPAEIATVLRSHPRVRDAVVMAVARSQGNLKSAPIDIQPSSGSPRLVAWIEVNSEEAGGPGSFPMRPRLEMELREFLQTRLPAWMIPSSLGLLPEFPRTTSGKIDRNELCARSVALSELLEEYVPPANATEAELCRVIAELLGTGPVGRNSDFFRLGGDSLLAAQLISRVRSLLGTSLPMGAVFRSPTPAQLAQEVAHCRVADEENANWELQPVPRGDGAFPVSFAQRRLWFLDQLEPGGRAYIVPMGTRLLGLCDVSALRSALDGLIARHESLRTTFTVRAGEPVQIIGPAGACPFEFVDTTAALADNEQLEAAAQSLATRFAERPFDLSREIPIRAQLVRMGLQEHVLLLSIHHIAIDGWSLGVIARELPELYRASVAGEPARLPALSIQYADFAVWQRQHFQGPWLDAKIAWWRTRLEGMSPLRLSTNSSGSSDSKGRGAVVTLRLNPTLESRLRELFSRENATLFMGLLAGWQVLLAKVSGLRDVAVGCPIANRNHPDVEGLIGFFVNSLVFRTDLSDSPTFRQLLARIRQTAVENYEHQDVPFEKLVEALQPERTANQNPLFAVTFAVQNAPRHGIHIAELEFQPFAFEVTSARFDLELDVRERDDGIVLFAFYREGLFRRQSVEQLLQDYVHLLGEFSADPDRSVLTEPQFGEVAEATLPSQDIEEPLARSAEFPTRVAHRERDTQRALNGAATSDHDASSTDPRDHSRLESLVGAWSRRDPGKIAVSYRGEVLRYGELDAAADRIALRLHDSGVSLESPVGILADRSPEAIVGMLAVLKAGGAYVPLDPELPPQRLERLLTEAHVRHVLCGADRPRFAGSGITCIPLRPSDPGMVEKLPVRLPSNQGPGSLAYILFTSGSTGSPRAVGVTHGSVMRLVCDTDYVHFSADDVVSQVANWGFDGSTFEIWGALLHGATLEIIDRPCSVVAEQLRRRWENAGVTVAFLPTSLFHQLASESPAMFRSLRYLIVGGEALSPGVAREVLRAGPARLVNGYGPTETTTFATWQPVDRVADHATSILIGRPIRGVEVYVVDRDLRRMAPGERGELCIAGSGVSRGYINDPARTAERFVPNPFAESPGERMYRTGDQARQLVTGEIEFLGRLDDQIKFRGHRVELSEIEVALQSHPDVDQAAVVIRSAEAGEQTLIGYVTRQRQATPGSEELPAAVQADPAMQIDNWRQLYEDLYRQPEPDDADWNLVGWNSSYTGQPIPQEVMKEQIEQTVRRIQRLGARRILEIGCGTGLLLFRLARDCQQYVGTDFSPVALDYIRRHLDRYVPDGGKVDLQLRDALECDAFPPASFDAVILNSVVQYFPSQSYLEEVIRKALRVLRPGGHLFLGDIRNLSLQYEFYTDVALSDADASTSTIDYRERVRFEGHQEDELLLDPRWFVRLARRLPDINDARIELKEGRDQNELTHYRYDVTLRVVGGNDRGEPHETTTSGVRLQPTADAQSLFAEIERCLQQSAPQVRIDGVMNARVRRAVLARRLLSDAAPELTVGMLRQGLERQLRIQPGIDPERFRELGSHWGYDVEIRPSYEEPGSMDVAFLRRPSDGSAANGDSAFSLDDGPVVLDAQQLASDPLRPLVAREFGARLAEYLRGCLPEYMVPSYFVQLDRFPLTVNGKIDRRALPDPPQLRSRAAANYVAPRTATEATLSDLWAHFLRMDRVGARDHFFLLGGHSLLATQVVTRIRQEFRVELPVRAIFEMPVLEELAAQIDLLLGRGAQQTDETVPIAPRDGEMPLSFAQQRLWFLDQLDPHSSAYNMAAALRLRGNLDVDALRRSLNAIVRRHEALRTTFPLRGGQPVQAVMPQLTLQIPIIDLSYLPESERDGVIQREALREESTPFDLAAGPLIRSRLLQCSDREWVLLLTMHHIVADGWSISIFTQEFAEHYAAFRVDREPELKPLPIQYADFARWQRGWLTGTRLQSQLDFWRTTLAGVEPLRLPTDAPRPTASSCRGRRLTRKLPDGLRDRLLELGQTEGSTLFMTLLAAFSVLLQRWSGQDDIAIGTPIANRNRQEIEGLIGFFVNTLVMRTNVAGDPTFRELLARVRESALAAFAHQDLPFEKLVEELRPQRELAQNPLFQVMFAVQNATQIELRLPELILSAEEFAATTTRFDLEVHVWEEDTLTLRVFYNCDLFEEATVRRWVNYFETLLCGIVARPAGRISELPLLQPDEENELLLQWNELSESLPTKTLVERFADATRKFGDRIAAVDGRRSLTYRELDQEANAVARDLLLSGAGPDVVIGLACGRSVELLIGMLGILKSGAAYLPLDLEWPDERLRLLYHSAGVETIVADRAGQDRISFLAARHIVLAEPRPFRGPETAPPCRAKPENLAYVMFTSGSSGEPKGVQITHANVDRLFQRARELFEFDERDVWTLFHSSAFDFSVWEIWGALLHGAQLVVIPYLPSRSPAEFLDYLADYRVTILSQTPTAFSQLLGVDALWENPRRLASLRYVVFGGESLDPGLLRRWVAAFGADQPQLINMYGITETTVHATCHRISAEEVQRTPSGSPIGKRLSDLQMYVLDEKLQPVPRGVIGEIYVGGAGLARGYWRAPALTAERFVPHPWGPPGSRLYRSGDLARFRDSGELEFWGRADGQIKLRGYRIEPGEIEHCLRRFPAVRDALVVLRQPGSDDPWLVAYVTRQPGDETPDAELSAQLHRHARTQLPDPMLPRAYVVLSDFPRSGNGKVQRSLLPMPAALRPELAGTFVEPRSERERQVAAIWAEVLRIDKVGAYDNFFDLGGHSLLATQVISRIRESLQVDLPLRALFEFPHLADLAVRLGTQHDPLATADNEIDRRAAQRRQALRRIQEGRNSR